MGLVDSQSVALDFGQMLDSVLPHPDSFAVWELPDSTRIGVDQVLRRAEFDSLQAERAAALAAADAARVADSLAAEALAADSLAADSLAADSLAADSLAGIPRVAVPVPPPVQPDTVEPAVTEPDTSAATQLLAQRPALYSAIVIITARPLIAGTRYWVEATVFNLLAVPERSGRFLVLPAAAEPDST